MSPKYNVPEAVRRTRLNALQAAKHHIGRGYESRDEKLAAAQELYGYGVFSGPQICGWLGLSPYTLDGNGLTPGWGVQSLKAEQLDTAIELAKQGIAGAKPKSLIHTAYHKEGMSFDLIGGLLCQHKNTISRIVKRIDGEPWT